jgi:hypothetical protein
MILDSHRVGGGLCTVAGSKASPAHRAQISSSTRLPGRQRGKLHMHHLVEMLTPLCVSSDL